MNTFRAVAIFPYIDPTNFKQFCEIATQMMQNIQLQKSILRYDMFLSDNNTRCTILEEYANAEALIEHVQTNQYLLKQLTLLGGKIEGSVFPQGQEGVALEEIRSNWDSKYHNHLLGKTN